MRTLTSLVCLICAGCVSSTDYPQDWPQPELATADCPPVTGTFQDTGQTASANVRNGDLPSSRLSRNFFDYEDRDIQFTRISRPNETSLLVESFDAGNSPLTRRISLGEDFSCSDGKLWLTEPIRIRDDPLVLNGEARIGLARSEDGALIGDTQQRAKGRFVVIPLIARESDHILWGSYE